MRRVEGRDDRQEGLSARLLALAMSQLAAVGIAVAIPWRYADDEPVVHWLLPLGTELMPDADPDKLKHACSLKWCWLVSNGRLRTRFAHQSTMDYVIKEITLQLLAADPISDGDDHARGVRERSSCNTLVA